MPDYGPRHRRERKRYVSLVESGGAICARCGKAIKPGQPWDLGHDDFDPGIYVGPEHRRCNRATAGRKQRRPRPRSRRW